MIETMSRRLALSAVAFLAVYALGLPAATAAGNDLVISNYGTFESKENPGNCRNACGSTTKNTDLFKGLVEDFGQVMATSLASPSTTLGQAGTSVSLVPKVAFIDKDAAYWQRGVQDGSPESAIFVPQLILRKGLPFSFEIAGTMSHIISSEMFTIGSQLKWALHEGFHIFPDVAVRGTVNTLVGAKELQMVTASWDASIAYGFPVAGIVEITPYAGYQQLHVWGWSDLLNLRAGDPRQPSPGNFDPQITFETYHAPINRFFFGTQLNAWTVNLLFEGVVGEGVYEGTASIGMAF